MEHLVGSPTTADAGRRTRVHLRPMSDKLSPEAFT